MNTQYKIADSYREAKSAPWWLARRDYFLAKVLGLVSADGATNAFCSYPLAVIFKPLITCKIDTSTLMA
jgi:hypothetical protein